MGNYIFETKPGHGWVLNPDHLSVYTHLFPKAVRLGTPKKDFYSGIPGGGGDGDGPWSNQAAHKKYFCCRDDVGQLEVRIPENYVSPADGSWVRATDTQSGLTGLGDPPDGTNINQNLRYFAYVLLSHGADGDGAQIIGSTARKQTHIAGSFEQENSNASSLIFYDWPINTVRNNEHFNDLLLWRTQEQVMSEMGSNSCRKP